MKTKNNNNDMRNLIIITTTTSTYLKAIHLECVGIERRFTFGLEKTFCKRNKKKTTTK